MCWSRMWTTRVASSRLFRWLAWRSCKAAIRRQISPALGRRPGAQGCVSGAMRCAEQVFLATLEDRSAGRCAAGNERGEDRYPAGICANPLRASAPDEWCSSIGEGLPPGAPGVHALEHAPGHLKNQTAVRARNAGCSWLEWWQCVQGNEIVAVLACAAVGAAGTSGHHRCHGDTRENRSRTARASRSSRQKETCGVLVLNDGADRREGRDQQTRALCSSAPQRRVPPGRDADEMLAA